MYRPDSRRVSLHHRNARHWRFAGRMNAVCRISNDFLLRDGNTGAVESILVAITYRLKCLYQVIARSTGSWFPVEQVRSRLSRLEESDAPPNGAAAYA